MTRENEKIQEWCKGVAELAVDVLVNDKILKEENFNQAVEIVAEEIFIRFILGDYPPPFNPKLLSENTQK